MSNKEIKKLAYSRLSGRWGTALSMAMFRIAFILAFVLSEVLIYTIFRNMGIKYDLTPSYVIGTHLGRIMMFIRAVLLVLLFIPESYVMRRLMLDLYLGRNFVDTWRYIQYNVRRLNPKIIAGSLVPILLKLAVLAPLGLGVYGIYYWGWLRSGDSLTTLGLFVFMLSIGFTIVWTGVLIYYSISLMLTKYILALNPRANALEACRLSMRLMDGQHSRYIGFLLSFVAYLPLIVMIYPILAIEPYFRMSEMTFAQDVMGSYWQDKYPAMIHRWSKYVG